MKTNFLLLAILAFFCFTSCEVKQTEEGKLPDVDVDAEAGKLPKYDVNWADVDVGTTTRTVKVPKVVVVMEEEEVQVPYVDVKMPAEQGDDTGVREERTLAVEAQVEDESHDLKIQEVYATENRLYVVATLKPTGQDLQNQTMRVSDQIVVNVPEDMNVKYYIIGEKPEGSFFNFRYNYISSRDEIADRLQDGKMIYQR